MASKQFKPRADVDKIRSFIEGEGLVTIGDTGSFADLKRLDVWELADKLESIDNQSLMWKWVIAMHIRDHYVNDTAFGQFIKQLREKNPYHPLATITQQHRHKFIQAARLCQRLKITDINAMGISPTVFYKIAAKKNEDYADRLYHALKKKNYKEKEADRIIAQLTSIPGITHEEPAVLERMDYDKDSPKTELRTVKVFGNIAEDAIIDAVGEAVEQSIEHHEFVAPVTLTAPEPEQTTQAVGYNAVFSQMRDKVEAIEPEAIPEKAIKSETWNGPERRRGVCPVALDQHHDKYSQDAFKLADVSSDDLILELATRVEHKSDEEIAADLMMISERYERSFTELSRICKSLVKKYDSLQV